MTMRAQKYRQACEAAIPNIQAARESGIKKSEDFAEYLNRNEVPAPTNALWSPKAVLRCFHLLKTLGLDRGSLPHGSARHYGGPRKKRVRGWQKDEGGRINPEALERIKAIFTK